MFKLNEEEYTALCNVIDQIEDREMNHYEESGMPTDHLYLDVLKLSLALSAYKYKTKLDETLEGGK
tara:strand:- start:534 stop:731 length:198 start_codon:yes stop_codon:yes gene_type:complete